jgi:excisionase family DNA binding protein
MNVFTVDKERISFENLIERINQLETDITRLKAKILTESQADKYLDLNCASTFLGMSQRSFYRILERGEIGFTRIGKNRKVLISDLKAYLDKRAIAAQESIL